MTLHENRKRNALFSIITVLTATTMLFMSCAKSGMHMQSNKPSSSAQMVQQDKHIMQRDGHTTNKPKLAILWLHGLSGTAQTFDPLEEKLLRDFGNSILLMRPTCREELKSIQQSIEHQAEEIFDYIKDRLSQYDKCLKTVPLIIFGCSQGGLVACQLQNKFGNQLKIRSIIPIVAPLMGTSVFNRTGEDIKRFINNGTRGLTLMNANPTEMQKQMQDMVNLITLSKTASRFFNLLSIPLTSGLEDMQPDSSSIQVCKNVLRDCAHNRHDLLIACHQNDFVKVAELEKLSDEEGEAIERLNRSYAEFVTGNEDELHDGLIATRSQLNRGPSLEDLSGIGSNHEDMVEIAIPGQPNSVGHLYKDVIHSDRYIVLGNALEKQGCWSVPMPEKRNVLFSEKIYKNSIKPIVEKVLNESDIDALKLDELALD